jgi:Tfp pilus assembly protein PilF
VCFETKQLDRAQQLVEELTGKKDGTLGNLIGLEFAGAVQAASGKRVVENRIKKAEEENKDSVRYWLGRAKYYTGRKEHEQAEDALKKALALPPDQNRYGVMFDYAQFLLKRGKHTKLEALYRAEIKRIGVKHAYAPFWIQGLQYLNGKGGVRFPWNDPILWEWFELQKATGFGQKAQGSLKWAAEHAGGEWANFKRRAMALADPNSPPPLRYAMGKILHRKNASGEGLAMMEAAFDQWPEGGYPVRMHIRGELKWIYLQQGSWRKAEKLFQADYDRLASPARIEWLRQLAVAAAKAGDKDEAMRFWTRRARQDLTDHKGLSELASLGMKDRLTAYYKALARRAPKNAAIAAALKQLEQ